MMNKVKLKQLGAKIKDLRESLGATERLTQEAFGRLFKVSRTQVNAWENGKEPPSKDKLIALGNRAAYPRNLWFWEQAGLDPTAIQREIRRTLAEGRGESALAAVTRIRRIGTAELLHIVCQEEENPKIETVDSIPFPSLFIPHPDSTFCIQATDKLNGSLISAGDLALVQLAPDERRPHVTDKLPSLGLRYLLNCFVAVFL